MIKDRVFIFNVKLFCRKFQVHFCLRFILVYKQLPTYVLYLFILWQKVKQYTLCSPITIRQNKNRKKNCLHCLAIAGTSFYEYVIPSSDNDAKMGLTNLSLFVYSFFGISQYPRQTIWKLKLLHRFEITYLWYSRIMKVGKPRFH